MRDSRSTAARAAYAFGADTVVSGGAAIPDSTKSSQPTTLISAGTRTPRAVNRLISPNATMSLNATTALAPLASTTSAAPVTPPSNCGATLPTWTISTWPDSAIASTPAARSRAVQELRGPPRYAILRWPRACRWATASVMPAIRSAVTLAKPGSLRCSNTVGLAASSSSDRSSSPLRCGETRTIPSTCGARVRIASSSRASSHDHAQMARTPRDQAARRTVGLVPSRSAAARTRSRVPTLTVPSGASALDTVDGETPEAFATSRMVTCTT